MSKYEYPRVHKPSSVPLNIPEPEDRPYSWVNSAAEPEDGKFRRQSNIPPLPQLPDHLNPALQSQQPTQPTQAPAQPTGQTPVPVYTADVNSDPVAYQAHPQGYASDVSTMRPPHHRTTPSSVAPEVLKLGYQPQQSVAAMVTVPVTPDAHPLEPSSPVRAPPRSNTPNFPTFQPSPPPASFPSHISSPANVEKGGTWRYSFCSCADTPTCLTGVFCPCVLYGKSQYRLAQSSKKQDPTNMLGYSAVNGSCIAFAMPCGLHWILAAIQHSRIRQHYAMSQEAGGYADDCGKALCCCCCTLAQDEKEIKWRETEARRDGMKGSEKMQIQYQTVSGMAYPGPPK